MRVKMIVSAGEYVAGEEYDLPDGEETDRFILLGYAHSDEDISRPYSEEEREALRATNQTVQV